MTTRVVNVHREPYDVYIGRSSKSLDAVFGNPYAIGKVCGRCRQLHATRESTEVALGIAETRSGIVVWVEPAFTISGFVVPRGEEDDGALEGVWVGALSLRPPGLFVARTPTESDGYFEIPAHTDVVEKGTMVDVKLF